MIGTLDPTDKRAVIVGAGISGLLMGYALKKNGFQVEILEASSRVGGLIETQMTEYGIAEKAAHSLLVTPEAKLFFTELGVELIPVSDDSKARFIYRNRKMRRMPLTFIEIIKTLVRVFSKPKTQFSIETGTLEDWGNAYIGPAATQFLLSPFITGIFATVPKRLLAKLAFPKLVPNRLGISLITHFRSRNPSPRPVMMTPKGGMSVLVNALASKLQNEIKLNHPVTELPNTPNLILTVPTSALSKLIRKVDPDSAQALLQVPYAPLITATCFFNLVNFKKAPKGVGVLIPRQQGLKLLGCLFNSSSFLNRTLSPERVSLTAMYGGTEDSDLMRLSDQGLQELINSELRDLLGATADAQSIQVTRWERAIPIYSHELRNAQTALAQGFCSSAGHIVFSNYSSEVSIRGLINATLHL